MMQSVRRGEFWVSIINIREDYHKSGGCAHYIFLLKAHLEFAKSSVSKSPKSIQAKMRLRNHGKSALLLNYIAQPAFEIYEKTLGRIPVICASNHFLTHKKDCPWYEQVEE